MRIIIQRVKEASVKTGGEYVSQIGRGALILLGITHGDTLKQAEQMSAKMLKLRLWHDEETEKTWSKSILDLDYEVIVVSQFTLYGILKDNKPDFHGAMPGDAARTIYEHFVANMRKLHKPERIGTGAFGQKMEVALINDGPVTMTYETKPPPPKKTAAPKEAKKEK